MTAATATQSCFTSPLSQETPVGTDPAYDPDFLRLGKEMEQSRSIQGRATDWSFVETEATRLLRDQAKDLRAASWLVVAKANLSGWSGAAEGLSGFAAFVERFWDNAHPQRARARASFVAWLWDGLARALESLTVDSAHRSLLQEVETLVGQLDAGFGRYLGDANPGAMSFQRFVRDRLESLPEDVPEAPGPEEPILAHSGLGSTPEEGTVTTPLEDQNEVAQDAPAPTEAARAEDFTVAPPDEVAIQEDTSERGSEGDSTLEDDGSLEDRVSRAMAMPAGRKRFLATLRVATVAHARGETDVALALCERLLPEVDETLEAWEPAVCADLFEAHLAALDAAEPDPERSRERALIFRRLLALNPPLAFRLRASRT